MINQAGKQGAGRHLNIDRITGPEPRCDNITGENLDRYDHRGSRDGGGTQGPTEIRCFSLVSLATLSMIALAQGGLSSTWLFQKVGYLILPTHFGWLGSGRYRSTNQSASKPASKPASKVLAFGFID